MSTTSSADLVITTLVPHSGSGGASLQRRRPRLIPGIQLMAMARTVHILFAVTIGSVFGQKFDCPSRTGFYPDPYQCDLYYECSKGVAEERLCPDGLVFKDGDPNREKCDIPAYVDCADRSDLQEAKPSEGCPRANGYFRHPDPQICNKFYNCVDGNPFEQNCPPGLVYDDLGSSTCSWPATSKRKDCGGSKKESLEGFTCPEEKIMGNNGRPVPHPTYPHPTDCTKFYICRDGQDPTLGSCSGGSVYNDETFQCDSAENVPGCENPKN